MTLGDEMNMDKCMPCTSMWVVPHTASVDSLRALLAHYQSMHGSESTSLYDCVCTCVCVCMCVFVCACVSVSSHALLCDSKMPGSTCEKSMITVNTRCFWGVLGQDLGTQMVCGKGEEALLFNFTFLQKECNAYII